MSERIIGEITLHSVEAEEDGARVAENTTVKSLLPTGSTEPRKSLSFILVGAIGGAAILLLGIGAILWTLSTGQKRVTEVVEVPTPSPTPTPTPTPTPAPTSTPSATPVVEASGTPLNLDITLPEIAEVKRAVLKRIGLMPNVSQQYKDRLYGVVDGAQGMGRLFSISFETSLTRVSPEDVEYIKSQMERPEIKKLLDEPTLLLFILGYADKQGGDQKNLKISNARAQAVMGALRDQFGILNAMLVVPMGGSDLLDARELAKNRVVEVWAALPGISPLPSTTSEQTSGGHFGTPGPSTTSEQTSAGRFGTPGSSTTPQQISESHFGTLGFVTGALLPITLALLALALMLFATYKFRLTSRRTPRLAPPRADSWAEQVIRVTIGETRCLPETEVSANGLLKNTDLLAYAHLPTDFYRLEFSLTMLPDRAMSLESGELSLELVPDTEVAKLPFFVRLHPEEETAPEKITLKAGGEGKAEIQVPGIGKLGTGGSEARELEVMRQAVTISSFGAGCQKAGWRFDSTTSQLIKTSITGLSALVAMPQGRRAKGRFRAEARLKTTFVDKFVRGLLFMPPALTFVEYEFPPTVEIRPPLQEQFL
jgi:outer membrane protein OmpA-like peptidoglycan-associated protein